MASAPRGKIRVDYACLNNISSEILFDTGRKPKGKFFSVDRNIERRKSSYVSKLYEFLSN